MRNRSLIAWAVVVGYTALTLSCAWGLIICMGESGARVTFLHTHTKAVESKDRGVPQSYADGGSCATPWQLIRSSWHIHVSFSDSELGASRVDTSAPQASIDPPAENLASNQTAPDLQSIDRGREPPSISVDVGASLQSVILLI